MTHFLNDSYRRLSWASELATRASGLLDACDPGFVEAASGYEYRNHPNDRSWEHVRFVPHRIPDPAADLPFLIADLAVNLNACLDMAISQWAQLNQVDLRRGVLPYFPVAGDISDDQAFQSERDRRLLASLPRAMRAAVIWSQPNFSRFWGRADLPANVEALAIREIANANKHRNISVVSAIQTGAIMIMQEGLPGEAVTDAAKSAWPDDFGDALELRFPTGRVPHDRLVEYRPHFQVDVRVARSDSRRNAVPLVYLLTARDFVERAPAYVERTLRLLADAAGSASENADILTQYQDRSFAWPLDRFLDL